MEEIKYAIYDGRFLVDQNRSICHDVYNKKTDAIKNKHQYGKDAIVVEMKIIDGQIISEIPV